MSDDVWVFGYGSLVNLESFSATIGHRLEFGVDAFEAELSGYGRRWNYGVMHVTASGPAQNGETIDYTIVALGVVPSASESTNGVVGRVDEHGLAALDQRERHYDRVDVTGATRVHAGLPNGARVVTYVPRSEAVAHYESARDRGVAAIERRYWDLVDGAFAALGPEQHARYVGTTPAPDVPVVELVRD